VPGSEKPAVTLNESILSRAVRGENLVPCLLREVARVVVVANFALGQVVLDQATGRTRGPTGLGGRDEVHVVVVGTAGEPVTIVVEEHSEVGRVVAGAVKANRLGQLRDVAQRLGRDARDCPGEATITAILPNAHDPVGRRDELFEVGDLLAPVVRRDAAAVAVVAAPAGSDEVEGS
jgi:hypothetical protein